MPRLQQPGTYLAKVVAAFEKVASTGTEQLGITFEIGADVPEDVGHITAYRAMTPATWEKFVKRELLALGWDADARNLAFEEIVGEQSVLIGREAEIKVVEEEGQDGQPRLVVKFINAPGGAPARPEMSAEEAKAFGDRLRAKLRGTKPPAAKAPSAPPAKGPAKLPAKKPAKDIAAAAAQRAQDRPAPPDPGPDDQIDFSEIPF